MTAAGSLYTTTAMANLYSPRAHDADAYDRSNHSGMEGLMRERTGGRQTRDITTKKDADKERSFWNAARQLREDAPSVR